MSYNVKRLKPEIVNGKPQMKQDDLGDFITIHAHELVVRGMREELKRLKGRK